MPVYYGLRIEWNLKNKEAQKDGCFKEKYESTCCSWKYYKDYRRVERKHTSSRPHFHGTETEMNEKKNEYWGEFNSSKLIIVYKNFKSKYLLTVIPNSTIYI